MDVLIRNCVEWHTRKNLQVLSSHDPMCPFHRQSLIVPDSRRVRISLFKEGVGISSTEVAGEAILAVSTPETMGVVEAIGVMNGPFPVTRTPFFPMLDSGLSFLDLIFAYISLLNLVIISTRRKNLLKKKKNPNVYKLNAYSFFLRCRCRAGRRETGQDQGYRRQRSTDLPDRPNFQSSRRILSPSQHAPYACF